MARRRVAFASRMLAQRACFGDEPLQAFADSRPPCSSMLFCCYRGMVVHRGGCDRCRCFRRAPPGCVSSVAAIGLTALFFLLALIGMWASLYRK